MKTPFDKLIKYTDCKLNVLYTFRYITTLKLLLLVVSPVYFDHDWLIFLSSRKLANDKMRAYFKFENTSVIV